MEQKTIYETRNQVKEEVYKMVSDNFDIEYENLTDKHHFERDLKADSLDSVELVMRLEDKFDVKIADEDAAKLVTVGLVVDHLYTKLCKR